MPRNVRTVGGRLAVGVAVALTGTVLPTGVASQVTTCAPQALTTGPAVPAGGASGSVAQPGPAPESPQACWTWSMDAYTMNADANELVAVGDVIVTVAHDPELVALDATTGTERWRYFTSDEDYATVHGLAAAEGVVFAGGMEGLDAIDTTDGTLLWRYPVDNPTSQNPAWGGFLDPAVVGGSVYGTTRVDAADGTSAYTLLALDSATGMPRWSIPITTQGVDAVASDGTVVAVEYWTPEDDLRWPNIGLFDAATGASLWSHEIRDYDLWAATRPIIAGSIVAYGASNGEVVAFKVADGKRAWRSDVGYGTSGLTAANGTVYVISDGQIHALNAKTGKSRWHKGPGSDYFLPQGTLPSEGTYPAVVDGGPVVMFAASLDAKGRLYALDPKNGKQLWRTDAGLTGAESGSPIVAGGRIVLVLKSPESTDVMSFGTP